MRTAVMTSQALLCAISFFFNDTATAEIYTLSLHDALPILPAGEEAGGRRPGPGGDRPPRTPARSEEHTSELQSRPHLVCRLLLEKKNLLPRRSRSRRCSCGTFGRSR